MKTNRIGIEKKAADQMIEKLNILLAHAQLFYMNTKGLHWNIKGEKFFELHVKFEELYTDLNLKVDEIAERIRALGSKVDGSFENFSKSALK